MSGIDLGTHSTTPSETPSQCSTSRCAQEGCDVTGTCRCSELQLGEQCVVCRFKVAESRRRLFQQICHEYERKTKSTDKAGLAKMIQQLRSAAEAPTGPSNLGHNGIRLLEYNESTAQRPDLDGGSGDGEGLVPCIHQRRSRSYDSGLNEIVLASGLEGAFGNLLAQEVVNVNLPPQAHLPPLRKQPIFCAHPHPQVPTVVPGLFFPPNDGGAYSRYENDFLEKGNIGRGGFGSVYRVLHKLDNAEYCVKKVRLAGTINGLQINRMQEKISLLLREVRTLAKLKHKNIVQYHNAWMESFRYHGMSVRDAKALQVPRLKNIARTSQSGDLTSPCGSDGIFSDSDVENDEPEYSEYSQYSQSNRTLYSEQEQQEEERQSQKYGTRRFRGLSVSTGGSDESSMAFTDASVDSVSSRHSDKAIVPLVSPTTQVVEPTVYDVMMYIQMEMCHEDNLEHVLRADKRVVEAGYNFNMLKQILEGLEHLHESNIAHRDLKPANVFLSCHDQEVVKLGDFGLAKDIADLTRSGLHGDAASSPVPRGSPPLKARDTGDVHTVGVGTHLYASPEQLTSSALCCKTDIFSFGIVALEMFQPFNSGMERVTVLSDARRGCFTADFSSKYFQITEFVRQCLSDSPSQRPSANDLLRACVNLTTGSPCSRLRAGTFQDPTLPLTAPQTLDDALKEKDRIIECQQQQIERYREEVRLLRLEVARGKQQ